MFHGISSTTSGGRTTRGRIRRTVTAALASIGLASALLVGPAVAPAPASTSTSIGVASATSYGFRCYSSSLRQTWPNIYIQSSTNQYVYVRTFLYRYNGAGWVNVATSPWYSGVSNSNGKRQIGYTYSGDPYYFAEAGRPSVVPANTGVVFTNLQPGYYQTREQYQAMGRQWSAWNKDQESNGDYCWVR